MMRLEKIRSNAVVTAAPACGDSHSKTKVSFCFSALAFVGTRFGCWCEPHSRAIDHTLICPIYL